MEILKFKRVAIGLFLPILILSYFSTADAQNQSPFSIFPYTVRDSKLDLLTKFELKKETNLTITIKEKGPNSDNIVLYAEKKFAGNKLHQLTSLKRTCKRETILEFRNAQSPDSDNPLAQLVLPPEPCWQDRENYKNLRPVIFAHISDTQNSTGRHSDMAKLLSKQGQSIPFQFILNTGDIVDYGTSKKLWLDFFSVAQNYLSRIPIVSAIGNHDYYGHDSDEGGMPDFFKMFFRWQNAPEEGYYSLSYPQFELIVFNSNLHKITNEQKLAQWSWLEKKLQKAKLEKKTVIVSTHYPIFSNSAWSLADSSTIEMRSIMVPLFEKYEVKLVLSGHTHLYERSFKSGTHYITAGPTGGMFGFPMTKNPYQVFSAPGNSTYSIIAVGPEAIRIRTFNQENIEIDSLSIPMVYIPRPS